MFGHPANGIAMRTAPEAVIKAFLVVDREAGRLLVMEGAARLMLSPGANHLHALADEGGERGA